MEKVTSILAVAERPEDVAVVLDKASTVARCLGARVEVLNREVEQGAAPMHEAILRHVLQTHPDLVIKAPAGDDDWELAQECPASVLLVRNRPWSNPARLAVAVDVSDRGTLEVTRAILHTACSLARGFHGNLDILYCEREQHDETVRIGRAVKLAKLVRESHVDCERIQVFSGEPAQVLPPLAAARNYDVLFLEARILRPPAAFSRVRATPLN